MCVNVEEDLRDEEKSSNVNGRQRHLTAFLFIESPPLPTESHFHTQLGDETSMMKIDSMFYLLHA